VAATRAGHSLTLDAGPLVALDRREQLALAWFKVAVERGALLRVPTPVLAEVWRGRHDPWGLPRILNSDVVSIDPVGADVARLAGELLAHVSGTELEHETIDAIVVAHASIYDTDGVLTTNRGHVEPLAQHVGVHVIDFRPIDLR
jgi:hypothetical protein